MRRCQRTLRTEPMPGEPDIITTYPKVRYASAGVNKRCPCGSGRRHGKCCLLRSAK